jgi:RES domain-containing protein
MLIYRISKCQFIDDLTGFGASQHPGRWNSKGTNIIYTAQSASLATLEMIVHLPGLKLNTAFCLLKMDIPDDHFKIITIDNLPENWREYPAPDQLKIIGDNFIKQRKFLALKVPSAVVPDDANFLINPSHADFKLLKIIEKREVNFDHRLFS